MNNDIKVIGHRGMAAWYPENTLLGFRKAVELGVDAVEFDVHPTADGEIVVAHDDTIDRCSDGTGYIHDKTLEELRSYDFGCKKDYPGQRISTLDEVLDLFADIAPGLFLLVEIKENDPVGVHKVIEIIRSRGLFGDSMVLSFWGEVLEQCHREAPEWIRQGFPDSVMKSTCSFDIYDKICIWNRDMRSYNVRRYQERGMKVDIYAADDIPTLRKAMEFGADSVTSNAPDIILRYLRDHGLHA